ncbi:Fic family protein [Streptomyces niveiscabiei]|uniref:Fic family protein n=1 Tax=Streptomyces niveiscabiei TaxID=164115 RepID=A0ABW9HU31_9ACTN
MRDDLAAWLRVRAQIRWQETTAPLTGPIRGRRDGIACLAGARKPAVDPSRADRLLAAWSSARADAEAGRPLDFERLAAWQRTVLGRQHLAFRDLPAFAKKGDERYGVDAGTPALFDAYLVQATAPSPAVPVAARAARLYLDVCFFHPFEDGNGRSALLALGYVLAREDIVLDEAAPLQVPRYADDVVGARSLVRLVQTLALATQRRAEPSSLERR